MATAQRDTHEWGTLSEDNLCAAFQRTARDYADSVALRTKGDEVSITWAQYAERAAAIAAGLAALEVKAGESVGLMLTNRPEFHLVDAGAMHLGAVPVSVYNTNPADEIEFVLDDSGARVVITEPAFADRVLEAAGRVDGVEHVVVLDDPPEGTISLAQLEEGGDPDFDVAAAWKDVGEKDLVTLIYTSGTTGRPKGVQFTHEGLMFALNSMHRLAPVSPGARVVSFLPMAHIAERYISHYGAMTFGYTITSCPDPRGVAGALPDARPTRFFGVPRIYEKMRAGLLAAIDNEEDAGRKQAMKDALETGLKRVRADQNEEEVSEELAEADAKADEQVFSKIRERVGFDELEWVAVAAAPTPYHVLEFFHAIGVPIAELWGMSECILATSNPPDRIKLGTVGFHLPGVEIKLGEDGEILVRGPSVTPGYRNLPDMTAEAIDSDGWLHSGDIATQDDDGYLTIVDRKKELIINAAGKNMSPANIEAAIKESSTLIGQALCVGDRRPYNVALVVLDPDAVPGFAKEHGLEDQALDELVLAEPVQEEIQRAMAQANDRLARVEQIKRFKILGEEWLPGGDELTPTSKLKRKPIGQKYEGDIDGLYADEAGQPAP